MKLPAVTMVLLTVLLSVNTRAEQDSPEQVVLAGEFKFYMRDGLGKMHVDSYLNSPSEIVSATACTLRVTSDDDYHNSYLVELNLLIFDGELIPFMQAKSLYLDENRRAWHRSIGNASLSVADLVINNRTWHRGQAKRSYMLISPDLTNGLLLFHHLTLGQPLQIELTREQAPSNVTIQVTPLSAKVASFVRKCMKLIDGNV